MRMYLSFSQSGSELIDLSSAFGDGFDDLIETLFQSDFAFHVALNELFQTNRPVSVLIHLLKQQFGNLPIKLFPFIL